MTRTTDHAIRSNTILTRTHRFCVAAALSFAAAFAAAAPASANEGATNRALELWEEIESIDEALDKTIDSLRALQIKNQYCKPAHPQDKSFDQAYLDSIEYQSEGDYGELQRIRTNLQRLVANDGRARAVIEGKAGDTSPVDPRFWTQFAQKISTIRGLKNAKQADLDAARVVNCGGTNTNSGGSSTTAPQPPADPLAGLDVAPPDYANVTTPTLPSGRICTDDEKAQIIDRVGAERQKARDNSLKAANFVITIGDILRKATAEGSSAVAQAVQPIYAKAVTDSAAREQTAQTLDQLWEQATALKVENCVSPDLTPAGALGGTQHADLGADIPDVSLKPVDFPELPDSVCDSLDRHPFVIAASTAMTSSMHNKSQWERRLAAIATAMRRGEGDAAKLQNARAEARTETAKWTKIAGDAQNVFDAAQAIPVVDCTKPGGLLEPGKTNSSIGGLDAFGVPDPDMKPVNIPDVPDYVCTDEEYAEIRDGLYDARDNSFHNLMEWNNRNAAIRDAITNGNGDEATLRQAQAEARAQSAHWRAVNDEAKQKIWNELPELDVRDCEEGDDKIGYVDPSSNGTGVAKASDADMAAALDNAIASKPDRGNASGSYNPFFGGRFGRKDGLGDSLARDAEDAVDGALRDLESHDAFPGGEPFSDGKPVHDDQAMPAGHENCEDPTHGHPVPGSAPVETAGGPVDLFNMSGEKPEEEKSGADDGNVNAVGRAKIADNENPAPRDRVFLDYNHFNRSKDGVKIDAGGPQTPETVYVNDRWQLNDRFNVNLGVRYDDETQDENNVAVEPVKIDPYVDRPGDGDRNPADIYYFRKHGRYPDAAIESVGNTSLGEDAPQDDKNNAAVLIQR